jgi:hypothetical protein
MTDLKPLLAAGALVALAIGAVACTAEGGLIPPDPGDAIDRKAMDTISAYDRKSPTDGRVSLDNETSYSDGNYTYYNRSLFETSDLNGDRQVDFGELVARMTPYDTNGDGRLADDEKSRFQTELGSVTDRATDLERLLHMRKLDATTQ